MRTNFQMTDQNITMVSGDTLSFNVTIKDRNGDPITVDSASFTAKDQDNTAGGGADISLSLGSGITQADGILTVRMPPSETSNKVGFYYYDMKIGIGAVGSRDYFTLLRGMLQIEPNP